jgi:peptide/nickel transport system substrate-binding protein
MGIRVRELRVDTLALVCLLAFVLSACSGEAADTTTTATTSPDPTTTSTRPHDPALDGPIYRIGLTSPIDVTNWWAAMGAEGTSDERAIFSNTKESLFSLTRPGFVQVPSLASTPAPVGVSQRGSVWVVEQPIRDDVEWSDGEPVTADDLVFYFDVVQEFALGGSHASNFPAAVTDVSAADEQTVRVEFGASPSLTDWQAGVAMAPLVPAHFWGEHVEAARDAAETARQAVTDAQARAAVAAASLADADSGNDITPEQVTADQIDAHRADVAASAGRDHLYSVDPGSEPSSGSLVLEDWEDGMTVSRSNPSYFARGTETTVFSDGSVRVAGVGSDDVYGGEASGEVLAHHVVGPFISGVRWRGYESASAAHEARARGEIDFVIDREGLSFTQYNEAAAEGGSKLSISQADGFRFLAFNLRKPPMSDPVFRKAVATVIDKELVASSLFNGTLYPAYTIVHPGLGRFDEEVNRPGWSSGRPMSVAQRFEAAIVMLSEAGYTWDVEPQLVYDDSGALADVLAGAGLRMPNGVDVPDLTIMAAPGSGEDPVRATYALWIQQWMADLGIPVTTEATDLESIVETAVEPSSAEDILSWDMHVLGWGGPDRALPGLTLVALFHSRNGVESGGLNTTGYSSSEFDAAADSFVSSQTIEEAGRWTREMERIISEDLPYVTLYRPPVIEALGRDVTLPVEEIMGGHAAASGWPEAVRLDR